MANVDFAALSDGTVAAALHQEILFKLGDRASLLGHPSLAYIGSVNGTGSNVRKAFIDGSGLDQMAAVADGASPSATVPTNANVQVTVARQAIQRNVTDLADMTWAFSSPAALIEALSTSIVSNAQLRFTTMITALTNGFVNYVGTSGNAFSVTNWFSAMAQLQGQSNNGPYLCVLHPIQLKHLQASLRSETGALQFIAATPELMAIKGQGYAGSYLNVDIFVSSTVPYANTTTDRAGCMMAYGAVAWADGIPKPVTGAGGLVISSGPIYVALERDESGAMTKVIGNHYVGAGKAQDLKGVSIITSAT